MKNIPIAVAASAPKANPAPALWRSLEEIGAGNTLGEVLAQHYPRFAEQFQFDRREFLKLMSASLALAGLGACSHEPQEKIIPYVTAPKNAASGEPRFFATACTQGGFAMGVLAESNMGRPTKIEGNPSHPASLGSTDVFAQASVLDLWDPDRSQTVTHNNEVSTWALFNAALQQRMVLLAPKQGEGLRILTETITSPTLAAQLKALLAQYPKARWHQYEPLNRDNIYDGTRKAFGVPLDVQYRLDKAQVILSLDADFLGTGNARVRMARDFAQGRGQTATTNRLYAIAACPSLTSAIADHHLALRASDIENAARQIAKMLGLPVATAITTADGTSAPPAAWLAACAKDLKAHRGSSLVIACEAQPAAVHALAHAMNALLGNNGVSVLHTEPVVADAGNQTDSMRALARDLAGGQVDTLLMLAGNPAYNAPADLGFAQHIDKAQLSAHLGMLEDETSAGCQWHLPATHYLEAWSDARAYDGSASIVQPLIAPLYQGKSAHEVLAIVAGTSRSGYELVREQWKTKLGADFEAAWDQVLHDGVIPNTAYPPKAVALRTDYTIPAPIAQSNALELIFTADAATWDGSYANNAWLQELPRPLSKLTWDNAVLISPALAARLGLANEDMVRLSKGAASLDAPIWISPGHADNAISLSLGCGRTHAGRVGNGHGFNAYGLRDSASPWLVRGVTLSKTGRKYALATTQRHHSMEGRDLVRVSSLAAAPTTPPMPEAPDSLYPAYKYEGYAWGMAINLASCIGCNACTIACQAENNIPVVGKAEVAKGREMHWIRVDRYYQGTPEAPKTLFQPVPCMHCENAPCEVVCPVEATVHDKEGLNLQVYNRCVGTRFCSNNCPYKVRRFNFFAYADEKTESLKAQRNPEVTVRMRGVMEKCSYCIQRITNGRIEADKDNRRIRDGEVVTACQSVCPTQAISFGDLNDPASRVNAMKASPLNYALLGELNTRPRTTYLGKVINPNPELES